MFKRKKNGEDSAYTWLATRCNKSLVVTDYFFTDGQANTGTFITVIAV